jgi:undecaprenyl-diphosphatase
MQMQMERSGADVAKKVLLPVGLLLLGMIGLGLLITKVLPDVWPFTVEDAVSRWFASRRGGTSDAVSEFFSFVGDTWTIITVTGLVACLVYARRRRWREPIYLAAAVTAQAVVFFLTTLVIDRTRPAVPHMDDSPPTSSFPSGHTSAAVALYAGLALLLAGLARQTWTRWLAWLLLVMPIGVAVSRIYRGMHHPSDVVGSFLNGGLCIAIMATAILWGGIRTAGRTGAR